AVALSAIAGIAQLVEHNLAKVGVAGSSPVSRFLPGSVSFSPRGQGAMGHSSLFCARVAKPVDARDLKSLGKNSHAGSIPAPSMKRFSRCESSNRKSDDRLR